VIGTVECSVWREGLTQPKAINGMLPHVVAFREVMKVEVQPAGWYPAAPSRRRKP
jgi:hypothetical protein